jgi:6-phosphogluconolactonase (cycloisomerase 2 family)
MKVKKICFPMARAAIRLVVLIAALTTASFAQSAKLSVASLTFSAQLIGTTGVTQSFTLTNTDSITPLALDSISGTADYSETDTCGVSLPPSGSCTIFVNFSPTVAGTIAGAITFQDEASNSPQIVSLSGIGLTPVSLSPTTLAFGTVAVGSKSVSKPVTLTDNQSTSVTLKFAASGDYTVIGSGTIPCGNTLAAHSSCTLAVTFQPTVNGSLNGALTIMHNAQFSPQDVGLSGTGTGGSSGSLAFSPTSLSFGNVVVGTTSAGKVVTVKNVSNGIVNITGFPASGNYAATGSGTTHCGGLLNPAQSCTFTVTFSPTLGGAVPGAVTVTDNAATNPQLVSLTGSGVQSVTLSPSSLTFPAQRLGTSSAAQIVTLTNYQAANTLVIDSISTSGDFSAVQVGRKPCGARVPALSSCMIGVVFSPAAGGGSITGALTVDYNASPSPGQVTLSATAKGTLPRFAYTNGDNTISSYTVDSATGQLRHTGYVVEGMVGTNAVVATPSGAFVYAANEGSGNVSAYSANAKTGILSAVSGSPFPGEPFAFGITVDPSSRFVYVANANSASNNISGYTINSTTGALTQMSGSPFQAGNDTRAIVVVPNGKFLYAANATSNDVSAYTINATTGVLTQIAGSPFPVPPGNLVPQSIAVDPATKFVYVGSSDSANVIAFTINPTTGALTAVAGSPFANPGGANYGITVDPSDRFVYVANDSPNSVSAYSINGSTGALTLLFGSPFAAGSGALSVAVDPSGRFLYLPDIGSNDVFMFKIDSGTGVLKLSRTIHGRSSSSSIALSNGTTPVTYTPKFAYVANNVDSNISGYTIDPETGVLTDVPGSPFTTGVQPTSIAVDPSGKFAYTANFNDNDVSEYTINALSGALTPVSGSPVLAQTHPFSVTVDPSGRFAYVANSFSSSISGYSINPSTGSLTALSGSPYTTGLNTQPFSVAIDPSGRFLCAAIENTNQVESFSIDPTSGKLAAIGSLPTGMSPELVVVDPSGRFVYVADEDGHVSAYTISTAGSLTQITGSPFLAGHRTVSVAVDPSGRFLYAANNGNGAVASFNVSAYTIDQNSGALTEIIGSPFATGAASRSVTVDPSGNFVYVANTGTNDVSAFTIDQTFGVLTENFASPFPAGSFAFAVTTTTDIH